jgi:hypothetical protein
LLFESFLYESLQPSDFGIQCLLQGDKPIERPHSRLPGMIFIATVVAMAACGSGSQEQVRPTAHDFRSEDGNEIPAPAGAILEQADHFELLSLDPRFQLNAADGDFHGYRVLGTAVIGDAETRRKLVSAFKRAVAEKPQAVAACFNPRHGIRVSNKGEQADFVICFECRQVEVSYGGAQNEFLINRSAESLFDAVLRSRGVPRTDR